MQGKVTVQTFGVDSTYFDHGKIWYVCTVVRESHCLRNDVLYPCLGSFTVKFHYMWVNFNKVIRLMINMIQQYCNKSWVLFPSMFLSVKICIVSLHFCGVINPWWIGEVTLGFHWQIFETLKIYLEEFDSYTKYDP